MTVESEENASDAVPMHGASAASERLARQFLDIILARQRLDPMTLGGPVTFAQLAAEAGQTITPEGLGPDAALRCWTDHLQPRNVAIDQPRFFAFIPGAPSEVSILFDLIVGALSMYGGSWLEGAGAVYAENQALRWLADLAGFPPEAGGTFVSGGTLGNLAALHAAREAARASRGGMRPERWQLAASVEAHSSIAQAARVLDVDILEIPVAARHHLHGDLLRATIEREAHDGLFGVVASAGATNLGVIDDLASIAAVCAERQLWLHVDGAYGLAALASPARRAAFAGIERADSFIVDPHKWLFAPYDSCALVYRDAARGRAAHSQSASYLDALNARNEWNPADYAVQLSRRARGLPFWFSLAVHGTDAYATAIEAAFTLTEQTVEAIRARPYLELLVEPELTVLVFRRHGWTSADYDAWSARLLAAGTAFVMPTRFQGEPAARLVVLNPRTTMADVTVVLDAMIDVPETM